MGKPIELSGNKRFNQWIALSTLKISGPRRISVLDKLNTVSWNSLLHNNILLLKIIVIFVRSWNLFCLKSSALKLSLYHFFGKSLINIIIHINTIQTVIIIIQIHQEHGVCVNSSSLSDSRFSFSKFESASFVDCSKV